MSKMLFPLTLTVGFVLAGCSSEPESVIEANNGTISVERETFKQRVEARFQEFERKLEDLRNKAIEVRVEIRAKLHEDIDELHRKEAAARQRWKLMWENGAEKWQEDKEHMEAALQELGTGFEKAFAKLSSN